MTGIVKSNVKNKLYKQFCQATNSTRRDILHQKFKNYRNQIVTLSCLCKENYFKTYFETNKKDLKRIWYGIKTLINTKISKTGSHITLNIDNKTTSDEFIIANHFNNFFTSIAGKRLKNIPQAKKTFSSFLTKKNTKTFFLSPTTAEEIEGDKGI